jgi:exosome complex exonuclease DIS3/RRP44
MNDRNDRAIRVAAKWYMRTLSEGVPIFLITNDKDNLKKALNDEISAKSIKEYINELSNHPELIELLNQFDQLPEGKKNVKCLHLRRRGISWENG